MSRVAASIYLAMVGIMLTETKNLIDFGSDCCNNILPFAFHSSLNLSSTSGNINALSFSAKEANSANLKHTNAMYAPQTHETRHTQN